MGKNVLKKFIISLYLISSSCFAIETGEMLFKKLDYSGPSFPYGDNGIEHAVFEKNISSDFSNLYSFFTTILVPSSTCPDFIYRKESSFIRYTYQLLAVSYLMESLIEYERLFYAFSLKGECRGDLRNELKISNNVSSDMSLFVKRASSLDYKHESEYRVAGSRPILKNISNWISSKKYPILQRLYGDSLDISKMNSDCKKIKLKMSELINERECYYANDFDQISFILSESNLANILKQGSYGIGCLERFKLENSHKDNLTKFFKNIFSVVFRALSESNYITLQGRFFLPGALKEFDEQGLVTTIFKEKKVKKTEPKAVAKIIEKALKKTPPKVTKDIVIHKKKRIVIKKRVVKRELKKFTIFHKTYLKLQKKKVDHLDLPMDSFIKENRLSENVIKFMKKEASPYETRDAIKSMKSNEKLGSFVNPLKLFFLKYLFDVGKHHTLFNIVDVLGKQFYVENDLDKISKPIFISMINNKESGYKWKITLYR